MHLLNTYWALALPAAAAPVAVFIFSSFFGGLPSELVDAARIDGAFFRILLGSLHTTLTVVVECGICRNAKDPE